MNILDTRDLIEERDELKQQILDSFLGNFEHYAEETETFLDICLEEEEIQSWKEDWYKELEQIEQIDEVESEVGAKFDFGCTLIDENDFEDYCEELVKDWRGVADDLRYNYSELEYQGITYLFRA